MKKENIVKIYYCLVYPITGYQLLNIVTQQSIWSSQEDFHPIWFSMCGLYLEELWCKSSEFTIVYWSFGFGQREFVLIFLSFCNFSSFSAADILCIGDTYIIIPPNTAHTLKIKLDENPFGKMRFFVVWQCSVTDILLEMKTSLFLA